MRRGRGSALGRARDRAREARGDATDLWCRRPRRPGPPARRVRPVGTSQPGEDPAAGEPLRRAPARPRGRVDLMTAVTALDDLRETVGGATTVVPVGSRTHWDVGGALATADDAVEVTAPDGVVTYDPADL